jgi:hypothetical protein
MLESTHSSISRQLIQAENAIFLQEEKKDGEGERGKGDSILPMLAGG